MLNKIRIKALAATLLGILLLVCLRRGLLVVFLALKILGHTDALDAWRGAVSHQTVVYAETPIDVYGEAKSSPAILIIHGVNPTGKDSLDLVRISEGLAQAGYQVYVPDLAEMRKQHLRPEEAAHIKSVFQFIGRDAGMACFSYGCGPALIAAADPDIRSHVRFAVAFGGYFDSREALEFVVTGPQTSIAYLKWVYLGANSDVIADEGDQGRVRKIAQDRRDEKSYEHDAAENLSPDAKALLDIFSASNPQEFRERLRFGSETLQRRLDALSPSRYIRQIRAPLMLIHGVSDPVIPAQQSIEFAEAARANGLDYSLTLLRLYGHVTPVLPDFSATSTFGFYLPETLRFLRLVNRVIAWS